MKPRKHFFPIQTKPTEEGCHGTQYDEEKQRLVCRHCKLIYPIKDDIPVMLIDEALPLEE